MPSIGLQEIVIVLIIALVVFGPKRLPEMGRQLGRTLREFKSATADIRSQIGLDDIADSVSDIKSGLSLTSDGSRHAAETVAGAATGAAIAADPAVSMVAGAPAAAVAGAPPDDPFAPAGVDPTAPASVDAVGTTSAPAAPADSEIVADEPVDMSAPTVADEPVDAGDSTTGDSTTVDEPVDTDIPALADDAVDATVPSLADDAASMSDPADDADDTSDPAVVDDAAGSGELTVAAYDEGGAGGVEAFGSLTRRSAAPSARTAAD